MILVTGGARSGKSRYAEQLTEAMGSRLLYIATAKVFDKEMEERVKLHKERRGKRWQTWEGYEELDTVLTDKGKDYDGILLDCVTTMLTNILFDTLGDVPPEFDFSSVNYQAVQRKAVYIFSDITKVVKAMELPVVFVTNEIGMGVVPETPLGRAFRDMAGTINQYLAAQADTVYMTVSGIPVKLKG